MGATTTACSLSARSSNAAACCSGTEPSSPDPMPLKWAKPADILRAARAVYADPKNNNPNKGEAEPLIRQLLLAEGITAVRAQIRPVLDRKEFANRRTKIGGPKRR